MPQRFVGVSGQDSEIFNQKLLDAPPPQEEYLPRVSTQTSSFDKKLTNSTDLLSV